MSDKFDNVSVGKKSNVFFDGKCVSHSVFFPDWQPGENQLRARSEEGDDDEDDHEYALARTTHELLLRLRKQVPSKSARVPKTGGRTSLGEDIFA